MSVQRYTSAFIGEMRHDEKGEWVLHSDYDKLVQDSIQDHHNWRSKLNFLEADYKAEVARLTAENERLRKAGDAMYGVLAGAYFGLVSGDAKAFDELPHIAAWNAAKEGGRK